MREIVKKPFVVDIACIGRSQNQNFAFWTLFPQSDGAGALETAAEGMVRVSRGLCGSWGVELAGGVHMDTQGGLSEGQGW